jgi:CheY-like chemotaxis protein
MPNVSGREVLEAMRSLAKTRDVPVVVVTGIDTEGMGLSVFGVKDILLKPVSVDRLMGVVRRVVGRRLGS